MPNGELGVAAVEIAHRAGAHTGGAHGQPRPTRVEEAEIYELAEGLAQRPRRIIAGGLGGQRNVQTQKGQWVGAEKPEYARRDKSPGSAKSSQPPAGWKAR